MNFRVLSLSLSLLYARLQHRIFQQSRISAINDSQLQHRRHCQQRKDRSRPPSSLIDTVSLRDFQGNASNEMHVN